jgi:squalene-hopene/tetraprenyl-beta-curcumene cyclase
LLDTQRPDGRWDEPEFTGTGFPRVFYLRYHLYPVYFPLLALGVYRRETA